MTDLYSHVSPLRLCPNTIIAVAAGQSKASFPSHVLAVSLSGIGGSSTCFHPEAVGVFAENLSSGKINFLTLLAHLGEYHSLINTLQFLQTDLLILGSFC